MVKCNIWSCAVILHIFLVGEPPYKGQNNDEIIAQMKASEPQYDSPDWKYVTSDSKDLC